MNKSLSETIDFLRFPLACMVVLLHLPGKYTNWSSYSFLDFLSFSIYDYLTLMTNIIGQIAVPVFFCISGYLFYCDDKIKYQSKMKSRTKSVLVPYLLWNVIALFLMVIVKGIGVILNNRDIQGLIDYLSPINIVKYILGNFDNLYTWQPIDAPLWFIRDLYIMFLLYPVIYFLLRRYKKPWGGILLLYISGVAGIPCLQMQTIFFFSLGVYMHMYNVNILKQMTCKKLYSIAFVAFVSFVIRFIWGYGYLMPVFILIFSGLMVYWLSFIQEKKLSVRIRAMKKYSFFIFASHIFIVDRLYFLFYHPLFVNNEILHIISYFLNPVVTVIMCISLFHVLKRISPNFLSVLIGTRIN